VSIGNIPGNEDPDRVPDFLCAWNLIVNEFRKRFPAQETAEDFLLGRAPVTKLMRELADHAAQLESPRGRRLR
jgi:hypothetical protein